MTSLRVALLASLLAVTACGDNRAPTTCTGTRAHVCGRELRDGEGRQWIVRGVNLAGAHKHAPYTDAFTRDDYAQLHAWGFRAIRFLVTWAAIEPTRGTYDESYVQWVRERMQWAHDAGLAVVLDMHQDVYGEGFGFGGAPRWTCDERYYAAFVPREPWLLGYADPNVLACFDHLWADDDLQSAFAAAWGHLALRLAAEPAIIGFDPLNEPHWGTHPITTFEPEILQPFYMRVIAAVRAHAPWVVFAEPASSRNIGFATRLEPFDARDIVYAPHMYDPNAEVSGEYDAARRDALLATAADLAADAATLDVPLWIGEYGGHAASAQLGAYMDAAYDGAAATLAGTMYWSFDRGGSYGMLADDGTPIAAVVDAIVRPWPERIAGELVTWSYDDSARTLEVAWRARPEATAPTIVVTPAHAYPDGITIRCEGCVATRVADEVHVDQITAPTPRVVIAPR